MSMREIAVVVSNANKDINVFDTIDAIQNAGFQNVFIQWYNRKWEPTQEEQLKYIREKGLKVIFAHLGYQNINDLWLDTEDGNELVERYRNDIRICKENNIPMVVMHLTGKGEAPKYNEIGLKRLQEIADYARTLDIKVAFENTKYKGYLDYVIENIKNDNVGVCFDSGHYHVHFNDELDFAKFKDRILAVHLHDNDKSDDLHLIPFDGTIDWDKIILELKSCNYIGPITMELCYRSGYLEMGIDNFYKKGYEVGEILKEMFEEEKNMDPTIVNDAVEFVRDIFKDDYSGHDYFHTLRVYKMATRIAEQEDADLMIVQLAALLHDVDDIKLSPETHANKDRAVAFLREHGISEAMIETICEIIGEVSFRGTDSPAPGTIEGRCVQDADRLDAMGAIGIARAFAYGGNHNRVIHDPDIKPAINMNADEYHKHISTTVNHFYEKLFQLKDMMNTGTAKKIAEQRDSYMKSYISEFLDEWDGVL